MQTVEYIEEIARRFHCRNNAEIGRIIGVSRASVSLYRNRGRTFEDDTCLRVAEVLGLAPEVVFSDMALERSGSPAVRAVWERLAKVARGTAAALLLCALLVPVVQGSTAAAASARIYYVNWCRRLGNLLNRPFVKGLWNVFSDSWMGQSGRAVSGAAPA